MYWFLPKFPFIFINFPQTLTMKYFQYLSFLLFDMYFSFRGVHFHSDMCTLLGLIWCLAQKTLRSLFTSVCYCGVWCWHTSKVCGLSQHLLFSNMQLNFSQLNSNISLLTEWSFTTHLKYFWDWAYVPVYPTQSWGLFELSSPDNVPQILTS